jgi:hypothetical protein
MKKTIILALIMSLCVLGLTACSESSSSSSPSVLINITGTWEVGAPGLAVVWTITQDGNGNLTGTAARTGDVGILTGTNNNNTINIHVVYSDATVDFTGTVVDNDNMNGTYSDSYGTTGENWAATRS